MKSCVIEGHKKGDSVMKERDVVFNALGTNETNYLNKGNSEKIVFCLSQILLFNLFSVMRQL